VVTRLTESERFWRAVEVTSEDGCWLWTRSPTSGGYGQFRDGSGRTVHAHRVAYRLLVGPVPTGLVLDHLCRTKLCVNPAHLEPVTQRENTLRGVVVAVHHARLARQTQCRHGHPLPRFVPGQRRHCKPCGVRRSREHRQRVSVAA
jgi:hypothetical protein